MSGTFAGKVLAEGQFANSKGTLYTVPSSTVAYIKSFHVYNTNAATQTVDVYLKPGSTSRQMLKLTLLQNESANICDIVGTFLLEAADLIEGTTTTATALDFVITGLEET